MPAKQSNADRIIELCNKKGVSIYLDGGKDHDSAKIGTPYSYHAKDKILTIFLVNLKPATKEKLIPFFKDKWDDLGILLKSSQEEVLESYIEYKESHPDQELIEFFKDKIPYADLTALKMSLFLRNENEKGNDISLYKQQIRERFGERGAYISNLCTGGYFEDDFMPAYTELGAQFDRYYELSVGRELKAIFVHSGMRKSTFREIFENRLINARRFNIKSFNVHGFGSWNVGFINEFFKEYTGDLDGMWGQFDLEKVEDESQPPSLIYNVILLDLHG